MMIHLADCGTKVPDHNKSASLAWRHALSISVTCTTASALAAIGVKAVTIIIPPMHLSNFNI
jgi:hypothetical protein